MKKYVKEYCKASGIHGLRYFSEKRSRLEKLWWVILIVLALTACAFFVVRVFDKWESSPIVTTLASESTPIFDIPFPAVTVCAEVKVRTPIFKIPRKKSKKLRIFSEEEKAIIGDLGFLCNKVNYSRRHLDRVFAIDSDNAETIINASPDFYPISCKLNGNWLKRKAGSENETNACSLIFHSTFTEEGLCYTFNLIDKNDLFRDGVIQPSEEHLKKSFWDMEKNKYAENRKFITFPYRARSGMKNALKFVLPTWSEEYDTECRGYVRGFRILIHAPYRFPNPNLQYIRIGKLKDVDISIKPELIKSLDPVKDYKPEQRNCYFADEKKLKFFKIYTQYNCELECQTNHSVNRYQCVQFYMPRESESGLKQCKGQSVSAMESARGDYYEEKEFQALHKKNLSFVKALANDTPVCDCLPLCTDIVYEASVSSTSWDPSSDIFDSNSSEKKNGSASTFTRVTIHFDQKYVIGKERSALYGFIDVLSSVGGLLGLFMGFSMLSLIEILYFLTVRVFCNLRLYGNWTGPRVQNIGEDA